MSKIPNKSFIAYLADFDQKWERWNAAHPSHLSAQDVQAIRDELMKTINGDKQVEACSPAVLMVLIAAIKTYVDAWCEMQEVTDGEPKAVAESDLKRAMRSFIDQRMTRCGGTVEYSTLSERQQAALDELEMMLEFLNEF